MHTASETATQRSPSPRPESALPSSRAEWASFNFGLLAALAACIAYWVLVALTVHRVI